MREREPWDTLYYASFICGYDILFSFPLQLSLALVRLLVVAFKKEIGLKQSRIAILGIWILSAMYSIRAPFIHGIAKIYFTDPKGNETFFMKCDANIGKEYALFKVFEVVDFVLVLFGFPLFIISFSYGIVIKHLMSTQPSEPPAGLEAEQAEGGSNSIEDRQSISLFVALCLHFALCQLPMRIYGILIHIVGGKESSGIPFQAILAWGYANAIFNPISVLIFKPDVRKNIFSGCGCK